MIRVVETTPDKACALTNLMYVSPNDELVAIGFTEVSSYVFKVAAHPQISDGAIGMGSVQRKMLRVAVRDDLELTPFSIGSPGSPGDATLIYCEVCNFTDKPSRQKLDAAELSAHLIAMFKGQIFGIEQQLAFEHEGLTYRMEVRNVVCISDSVLRGYMRENTGIVFTNAASNPVKI